MAFAIPDVTTNVHLVEVVITHGHYEVTLDALVASLTKTETLLAQLVDTLLGRMTSSSSKRSDAGVVRRGRRTASAV